jgi:hypothetical protein
MKHKARRLFQFIAIKWLRLFETKKTREPSDYEKECFYVCKALINQEDSVLLMSPISGKRYIKSEDDQIFIIIEENQITIVNHNYSYNIDLWGTVLTRISNVFDIEVEKRRASMETEIRSNVKHSLSNIYKNLTHAKSTQ